MQCAKVQFELTYLLGRHLPVECFYEGNVPSAEDDFAKFKKEYRAHLQQESEITSYCESLYPATNTSGGTSFTPPKKPVTSNR